ncbi:MAG: hypothetical protein LBI63_05570 [Candidatus Ancillula sp.]|jgi:hypothetical protein|nr:hypothetical protein [Candidatus Ancillula sp.]
MTKLEEAIEIIKGSSLDDFLIDYEDKQVMMEEHLISISFADDFPIDEDEFLEEIKTRMIGTLENLKMEEENNR